MRLTDLTILLSTCLLVAACGGEPRPVRAPPPRASVAPTAVVVPPRPPAAAEPTPLTSQGLEALLHELFLHSGGRSTSVYWAMPDGACARMDVHCGHTEGHLGLVGGIDPGLAAEMSPLPGFSFEYYDDGLLQLHAPSWTFRTRAVARLPECKVAAQVAGADHDAIRTNLGDWYLSAASCGAAVAAGQARPMGYGACSPIVASVAAVDDAVETVAEDRVRAEGLRHSTVYWLELSSEHQWLCLPWQFRAPRAGGREGAIRNVWQDSDGARGYTEFQYSIAGAALELVGPNSEITRQPPGGGRGMVDLGCTEDYFVDPRGAFVQVGDVPWYRTEAACEAERSARLAAPPDPAPPYRGLGCD